MITYEHSLVKSALAKLFKVMVKFSPNRNEDWYHIYRL